MARLYKKMLSLPTKRYKNQIVMKRIIIVIALTLLFGKMEAQTVDSIPHHHVGYEGLFNSGQFEGILQMRDGNVLFNFLAGIHSKDRKERVGFHAKSSRDFSIVGNVFYKTSRHGGIVLDSIFIPDTDPSEFLMEKNPYGDDHIRVDIVHDSASGGSFLQIFPFDNDFRFDSLNRVFVPLTDTFAYGLVGGFIDEQNDIVFAYNTPYGIEDDDWDFHIARFGLDGTLRHENTIPFSSIPINFSYNGFGIFNESPREYYRLGTNRFNSTSTTLLELVCHVFDSAFEVKDSIFIAESSLSPENPRLKYFFGWREGLLDDGDDFIIYSRFVWRGVKHGVCMVRYNKQTLEQKNAVFFESWPMNMSGTIEGGAGPIGLGKGTDGSFYLSYNTCVLSYVGHIAVAKVDADFNVIWQRYCLEPEGYMRSASLMKVLDDDGVAICGGNVGERELFFLIVNDDYDGMEEQGVIVRPYAYYPNPTRDELRLHYSPDVMPTQIELYDLQGRLVKTQRNGLESLNLQGLSAGTYTMRVILEGGKVFSDKVVKE